MPQSTAAHTTATDATTTLAGSTEAFAEDARELRDRTIGQLVSAGMLVAAARAVLDAGDRLRADAILRQTELMIESELDHLRA